MASDAGEPPYTSDHGSASSVGEPPYANEERSPGHHQIDPVNPDPENDDRVHDVSSSTPALISSYTTAWSGPRVSSSPSAPDGPPPKRRRTGPSARLRGDSPADDQFELVLSRLHHELLPLSPQASLDDTSETRIRFARQLYEAQIPASQNSKEDVITLSSPDIVEITNLFFYDLIGPGARNRLSAVINACTSPAIEIPSSQNLDNAIPAVVDFTMPQELREFFIAWARLDQANSIQDPFLHHIHRTHLDLQLLEKYKELKKKAEHKSQDFKDFLAARNLKPTTGRNLMTCTLEFIKTTLKDPTLRLASVIQSIQGVDSLVAHFTRGILVILPLRLGRKYMLPHVSLF